MLTFRRVVFAAGKKPYHYFVADLNIALQPMYVLVRNRIETTNIKFDALLRPLGLTDLQWMLALSRISLGAALNPT